MGLTFFILCLTTAIAMLYIAYRASAASTKVFVDMGIEFVSPASSFLQIFCMRFCCADNMQHVYKRFSHRSVYGFFSGNTPVLVIREPDLIKAITVRHFDHFVDHRELYPGAMEEPLIGKSMFQLRGNKWRDMRATLSPAFTGRKVRYMFHLVVECAQQMVQVLRTEAAQSMDRRDAEPYSRMMMDLSTRFASDVIASAAFGIRVDSLRDRDNSFYTVGKVSTLCNSWWTQRKILLMNCLPTLSVWMGIRMFTQRQRDFYHNLVHGEIRHRQVNGIERPDMIQLLMDARRGYLKYEAEMASVSERMACSQPVFGAPELGAEDVHVQGFRKRFWDDEEVTAQCYLFFLAGYDTISTLLTFAVQELAVNCAVQDKLLAELDDVRQTLDGGPLTYELLHGMMYLDMVVTETLRKWPPGYLLDRDCTKDYEMSLPEGGTIHIPRGMCVWLPVYAIHRDPLYYSQPNTFDPERFSEQRKHEIRPFTFLGLGAGPRNCIGSRFALMEVKAFLYYLLSTFTLEPSSQSYGKEPVDLHFDDAWNIKVHLRPRSDIPTATSF